MIGRAPMMLPPQCASPPMQMFPATQPGQLQQGPPPRVQPPQQAQGKPRPAPQPQAKPLPGLAQQPVQPIVARGKPYDDPPTQTVQPLLKNSGKSAPLALPSPEELGVAANGRPALTATAKVDWNSAHERVQRAGGAGLQVAKLSDGRFRVGLVLRTNQADEVHHVEATAATEADAVAIALARAEAWAAGQP